MKENRYNAGLVKYLFWFHEQQKMIEWLHNGYTVSELKEKNKEENLFNAKSQSRAESIFNHMASRLRPLLETGYIELFMQEDLEGKRLLVLISLMVKDRLFFDFMYHVIREKMLLGTYEIENKDFRIFFNRIQSQDEKVAQWTEKTLVNLAKTYKNILYGAGMLIEENHTYRLLKPIVDVPVQSWLSDTHLEPIKKVLAGEM